MLRNPAVYRWRPVGLSDARDGKYGFNGGCKLLQNLIHDPVSNNMIAPRPAAFSLTTFSGFSSPGVISLVYAMGTRIFGMVASALVAGHDEPFCYDTSTNSFVTITGMTSSNLPVTPATSGPWTPPDCDLVGTKLIVTHPGFTLPNAFGWIDLSNPAAPVWSAGNMTNTTSHAAVLPGVATAVQMFNDRAYFSVKNLVYFSDALQATNQTDAGQVLTVGDLTNVTGFAPQGVDTSTQGILQAMLVFKGDSIWQVTGDWNGSTAVGGTLALNQLTSSVGCSAPMTIQPTPSGIMFLANDGVRNIPPLGMIVQPPHPDVLFPFYNCTEPSRAVAAYAANTYRIALDTITTTDVPGRFEYWFAMNVGKWNGPHTLPTAQITNFNSTFIVTTNAAGANLLQSNANTSSSDTFVELGNALTFNMTSTVIDPDPPMAEKTSVEVSIMAVWGEEQVEFQILDAYGNLVNQTSGEGIDLPVVWGGGETWGGGSTWTPAPYNSAAASIFFNAPIVVNTFQFVMTGASQQNFRFAHMLARYEALQYTGVD